MKIAELFGDNMILQREQAVPVWGTAEAGEIITVKIQNQEVSTNADTTGKWEVTLSPLNTSKSETLIVSGANEDITISNVAVGEVWIAGGQSNMEFFMRYDKDFNEEVRKCDNPDIRFFDYPMVPTEKYREVFDYSKNFGFWRKCDADNLQWYSAVAYYFAKYLQADLDVPVGIVGMNCGGSRTCCWMDEATLMKTGPAWMEDYKKSLEEMGDLKALEDRYFTLPFADHTRPFEMEISDRLMYGVAPEELDEIFGKFAEMGGQEIGPWHEWRPCGLYHTMLENVAPFATKGVLWYQGESDVDHADIHAKMLESMINLWREKWSYNLAFVSAQIAPWDVNPVNGGGTLYPVIRAQQASLVGKINDYYLVPTSDVGNAYDIHPKEKQPVGRRMALAALGHVYDREILCDAPAVESAKRDNDTIIINFKNTGDSLSLDGTEVEAIHAFEKDNEIKIDVSIDTNHMIIKSSEVSKSDKIKIEFAETPYYKVNLYNSAGIPVMPFSIEV